MTEYTRELAKITSTFLGLEDHGVLTAYLRAYLRVDYGGASQSIGGNFLDDWDETSRVRVPSVRAGAFVAGVIAACGVDSWEQVAGRTVYVLAHPSHRLVKVGIENLPTERGGQFLFADAVGRVTS